MMAGVRCAVSLDGSKGVACAPIPRLGGSHDEPEAGDGEGDEEVLHCVAGGGAHVVVAHRLLHVAVRRQGSAARPIRWG